MAGSQKNRRYPGNEGDEQQTDKQPTEINPDAAHGGIRRDPPDDAGGIVAKPERRREQAEPHREDDDHAVMHLVDPELLGDRKQQRPEQHDRRDALEYAAEDDEGEQRNQQEAVGP